MKTYLFLLLLSNTILAATHLPDKVIIGTRFQSILTQQTSESDSGFRTRDQDLFLRRARFELKLLWDNGWSQSLDIRNDNSNRDDRGEEKFLLGDAYFGKKIKRGNTVHDIRFYRAKVDVSRSQTVSSADLIYLNRSKSSDFASDYVSHNRRATNMQWNGIYNEKLQWQLSIGDGVQSDEFRDAQGNRAVSVSEQRLMYGGKLRYFLIGKAQKKVNESFFDDDNFISLGTGVFRQDQIDFTFGNGLAQSDRTLYNVELTAHLGRLNVLAEYFSFSDVHLDFNDSLTQAYRSEAFYVQLDYRLNDKYSLYSRFESWDKAVSLEQTSLKNYVLGVNYFHFKNAIKFGVFWDRTTYDQNISTLKEDNSVLMTAMLHFR